jgi:hypothetical protein
MLTIGAGEPPASIAGVKDLVTSQLFADLVVGNERV